MKKCERPGWLKRREGGDLRVLIEKVGWGEYIMTTERLEAVTSPYPCLVFSHCY